MDQPEESPRPLVVLGASAGGLEPLELILERLPAGFAAPIVVVQHLDPRRPSHLQEILGRRTALEVVSVDAEIALAPGRVHVLPPDRHFEIQDSAIVPLADGVRRPTPSIDEVLTAAARVYGEGTVAVILSGLGSDGAVGAREVKGAGGTVVIQNPDTAAHASMPQAISPSLVDIVADAEAIGPLLSELVAAPAGLKRADEDRLLRSFLEQLREQSGIDFSSYKRGTILRRLQRRMVATSSGRLKDYATYVAHHPEEYQRLASSFLIKVTEFFRDADLFDRLRDEVIPRLIVEAGERENELRIWSAGCATGEEAYSLAMLVADALGERLPEYNVRIFATDVDLDAIAFARRGVYSEAMLANVPAKVRDRHFSSLGDGKWEVRKHIRALTVFGQHDLGHRAPFPRVDLALCRNVLIYFTADLQKRALQLFAFALREGGYLVLGKAESTTPLSQHFVLENARLKIYRREGERVLIPPGRIRDTAPLASARLPLTRRPAWPEDPPEAPRAAAGVERSEQVLMRLPVGVAVVNRTYDLLSLNAAARRLLSIHGPAIGEDIVHLVGGDVGEAIKGQVDAAFREESVASVVREVAYPSADGEARRALELSAHLGPSPAGGKPGAATCVVVVQDVTSWVGERSSLMSATTEGAEERRRLAEQVRALGQANAELARANQELTTVNAELRNTNEELLVANEEVQAATEEVETLNEELQATNEELETLNEELQATVEELNATNDDLEARTMELQEGAVSLEEQRATAEADRRKLLAILDSLDEALLVVDRDGQTVKANRAFRELVGDPERLAIHDADGAALTDSADPRRRALAVRFDAEVRVGTRRFQLSGRPVDGDGETYAALIFRPRG